MFRVQGDLIVNEHGNCIDVAGGLDKESQNIVVHKQNGQINQKWRIIYVDEDEEEPTKGQLNKDFGLIVERPFYIVSAMSSGRYLDILGNNVVIKTANGYNTQRWIFDQKTKTIKSVGMSNRSLDIQSAGKSANLQVWSTNSGWW